MKKTVIRSVFVLRLVAVIAIAAGGWTLLQVPFMKFPTPAAIQLIEREFVRTDLTEQDRQKFDFCKRWILGNNRQLLRCLGNAKLVGGIGMPIMGILLILTTRTRRQNIKSEHISKG